MTAQLFPASRHDIYLGCCSTLMRRHGGSQPPPLKPSDSARSHSLSPPHSSGSARSQPPPPKSSYQKPTVIQVSDGGKLPLPPCHSAQYGFFDYQQPWDMQMRSWNKKATYVDSDLNFWKQSNGALAKRAIASKYERSALNHLPYGRRTRLLDEAETARDIETAISSSRHPAQRDSQCWTTN